MLPKSKSKPLQISVPSQGGESRIVNVKVSNRVACPICRGILKVPFLGSVICCGLLFETSIAQIDLVVRVLGTVY